MINQIIIHSREEGKSSCTSDTIVCFIPFSVCWLCRLSQINPSYNCPRRYSVPVPLWRGLRVIQRIYSDMHKTYSQFPNLSSTFGCQRASQVRHACPLQFPPQPIWPKLRPERHCSDLVTLWTCFFRKTSKICLHLQLN